MDYVEHRLRMEWAKLDDHAVISADRLPVALYITHYTLHYTVHSIFIVACTVSLVLVCGLYGALEIIVTLLLSLFF